MQRFATWGRGSQGPLALVHRHGHGQGRGGPILKQVGSGRATELVKSWCALLVHESEGEIRCPLVIRYAPEHLIVNVSDAEAWLPALDNAGSVFLGRWTPESVGDYASGTNHVLPTYGYARMYR